MALVAIDALATALAPMSHVLLFYRNASLLCHTVTQFYHPLVIKLYVLSFHLLCFPNLPALVGGY
jgi:hypothetical protein